MEYNKLQNIYATDNFLKTCSLSLHLSSGSSIKAVLNIYLTLSVWLVNQIGLKEDILWKSDKWCKVLEEWQDLTCIYELLNIINYPVLLNLCKSLQLTEVQEQGHDWNLIINITLDNLLEQSIKYEVRHLFILNQVVMSGKSGKRLNHKASASSTVVGKEYIVNVLDVCIREHHLCQSILR